MPEHATWFSLLPGYSNIEYLAGKFLGPSYVGHSFPHLHHVVCALVVLFILSFLGVWLYFQIRIPKRVIIPQDRFSVQTIWEVLTEAVLNLMEGIMGKEPARYFFPFIGTLAFFILFSNLLGLVPGFMPPTSNWNTTVACAIIVFFATHIYGVKTHGIAYFRHFLGPIVKWYAFPLMIIMVIIEFISHLARPLSLSMRLMGNMFADHKVCAIFLVLIPLFIPLPIMVLGILVCIVQTLVFIVLSMVYISMATKEEH
jgi:F-type H+-transporting ATPase subunit a